MQPERRLAAGGRPPQQFTVWVKTQGEGKASQVCITNGRLDVATSEFSAAPKLGSYWSFIMPVLTVSLYSPEADTDGWVAYAV